MPDYIIEHDDFMVLIDKYNAISGIIQHSLEQ
jgi:hypothetical protein